VLYSEAGDLKKQKELLPCKLTHNLKGFIQTEKPFQPPMPVTPTFAPVLGSPAPIPKPSAPFLKVAALI
jgi:hypothetical protein